MKTTLLFITLPSASECLIAGGGNQHGHCERHKEIIVGTPAEEVRTPEVTVH